MRSTCRAQAVRELRRRWEAARLTVRAIQAARCATLALALVKDARSLGEAHHYATTGLLETAQILEVDAGATPMSHGRTQDGGEPDAR